MNKILTILDWSEKTKYRKLIYYLLIPIFYLLELICFLWYWNIIKKELLTSEEIVHFLDENEFGYKWHKLYKKDIIEPDSIINKFNIDESIIKIKAEFTRELTEMFKEHIAFDIENYINLNVTASTLSENSLKQYTVEIKYYRYFLVNKNLKWLILWIPLAIFLYQLINVNIFG